MGAGFLIGDKIAPTGYKYTIQVGVSGWARRVALLCIARADLPTLETTQGQIDFLKSTPIQMLPPGGSICQKLAPGLPPGWIGFDIHEGRAQYIVLTGRLVLERKTGSRETRFWRSNRETPTHHSPKCFRFSSICGHAFDKDTAPNR